MSWLQVAGSEPDVGEGRALAGALCGPIAWLLKAPQGWCQCCLWWEGKEIGNFDFPGTALHVHGAHSTHVHTVSHTAVCVPPHAHGREHPTQMSAPPTPHRHTHCTHASHHTPMLCTPEHTAHTFPYTLTPVRSHPLPFWSAVLAALPTWFSDR